VAVNYNKRTHRCGSLRKEDAGQTVTLAGWVDTYRDHGGMVFIDLRDHEGITQCKFNPQTNPDAHEIARALRNEYVIAIEGNVAARGENVNPKIPTGEIEVEAFAIELLAKAEPTPFEISGDAEVNEDLRLRYRYLDLRRPAVQSIFRLRHRLGKIIRDYFDEEGFVEIETPFLTKSTPEGARDYLVPSRVQQGTFYALPQSPQIFKQLFMIAGFDRYAQIVRCFRDEDLRGNRQPEFTQVDLEMAFVKRDDVMDTVDRCIMRMFKGILDVDVTLPIPRMTYKEAMDRFGVDRPDTRFGLELQDITDLAAKTEFGVFTGAIDKGGVVKCIVVPGGETLTRKIIDGLADDLKGMGGGGLPFTKITAKGDGVECATGIAKFMQPHCAELCEKTGAKAGDAVLFMPGSYKDASKYLHYTRTQLGQLLKLIPENRWDLLWVIDFPLVDWNEDEKRWDSTHHPFTAPVDEDIHLMDTDPGKVRDQAYDLVLNGEEMAGGSIRIHRREVQRKVFDLLGIGEEEAQAKFGHLLEALTYGAPPHGGIAFGFDRWAMLLAGQPSLRDVIAYPKTQRAVCPLTSAPSEVAEEQLLELGIDLRPEVRAKREGDPA
jgi:aspartyl-tRNA synthetase